MPSFDIYEFAEPHMADLVGDGRVEIEEGGGQLRVTSEGALELNGGGAFSTDNAHLAVQASVPQAWTLEFNVTFHQLPKDFLQLELSHVFVGATDASGPCAGLFFSKVGIGYAGAISHSPLGLLRLDSSFEILPGSRAFVEEHVPLAVRLAADRATSAVYVYVTRESEVPVLGHQLRYVLPGFQASDLLRPPTDRTLMSVRGTLMSSASLRVSRLMLGAGLFIANLPPRADAGRDQAVRTCAIVRLDGTSSRDPEGAPLSYRWHLIDAPGASSYAFEGTDGRTDPGAVASGFTDTLRSSTLETAHAVDPFVAGDMLVVSGKAFEIVAFDVGTSGLSLRIARENLPDTLRAATFKILRQRLLTQRHTATPSFVPDVIGIYKFELVVSDGELSSQPAFTIVNVLESMIPRGCIPELGFVWNYLSDFWKLVEDQERLTVFFQALAQVAATELLTLWQVDYEKSLRDIQRRFQRRWLHYDLLLGEPLPELTRLRHVRGHPRGTGVRIAPRTFKVDISLAGVDVREGDVLSVDGEAFRILRVVDEPADEFRFQRVVVERELSTSSRLEWEISGYVTSRLLDFYAGLVTAGDVASFEVFDAQHGSATFVEARVASAPAFAPGTLAVDLDDLEVFLLDSARYRVALAKVLRRRYVPIDPLVVEIPCLQELIEPNSDAEVLRQNVDYFIDSVRGQKALRFVTGAQADVWEGKRPPDRLWAETSFLDNRPTIEANFGIPAELRLEDVKELGANIDYLAAVRGLWYAFLHGPTIFNLRAGTQILLGLPFAEEAGSIEEIRPDFSPSQGRILVRDRAAEELVRSYSYPRSLELELNPATRETYQVGDEVSQFAPLVKGIEILDWQNAPRWFEGLLRQGVFHEVEKFFRFMVRVDSRAFSLSALMLVRAFILRMKPTYTHPLFVVLSRVDDTEVSITDSVKHTLRLLLNAGASFQDPGLATMFDQPRPAGGGWFSSFDADADPNNPHVITQYPNSQEVAWGFDKNYLCPEDLIAITARVFHSGGVIRFDAGLTFDTGVRPGLRFHHGAMPAVLPGPIGTALSGSPASVLFDGTVSELRLTILGTPGIDARDYRLVVTLGSAGEEVLDFEVGSVGFAAILEFSRSYTVNVGDMIAVRMLPASGGERAPNWTEVSAEIIQSTTVPRFDIPIPATTFSTVRTL